MKHYKMVIFDLDGTLMDTSEGIFQSVRYAESRMGLSPLPEERLKEYVGPPPKQTYMRLHSLTEEEADRALVFHRQYAVEKGQFQARVYEDVPPVLSELKRKGYLLAVATLKRETIAQSILSHFGLAEYFDCICGADEANRFSKKDVLMNCIRGVKKVTAEQCVLVGDSSYDAKGAEATGMDFIGLTCGFGFHTKDEVDEFPNVASLESLGGLLELL